MDRDRDEAPGQAKRHGSGDVLRHPFPSCWSSYQQPLPHEQGLNTGLSLCLPPGDLPDPAPSVWAAFKESIFSHALWIRVTKLPLLSLRERALWSFTSFAFAYSIPDAGPQGLWLAATSLLGIVLSPREHLTQGFPDPVMTQSWAGLGCGKWR